MNNRIESLIFVTKSSSPAQIKTNSDQFDLCSMHSKMSKYRRENFQPRIRLQLTLKLAIIDQRELSNYIYLT